MAYLILVRHGRSEWNDKGMWTGITDIPMIEIGREEVRRTAHAIKDLPVDVAYVSPLIRAHETLDIILDILKLHVPIIESPAITERDYGIYTAKNKWQIQKEVGDEEFKKIRRSWAYPIPGGESLKKVYERTVPYYETEILPRLKSGKNVLVSAHGNSLRALVKKLENISDDKISDLEIKTGEAWIYQIGPDGKVLSKEIRGENEKHV